MLTVGLLLGLLSAPLLWVGTAAQTHAQSLPFTPTPEPTETPTTLPPTATPTDTAEPPTLEPIIVVATPTPMLATATPLPPGYGRDICDPNHTLSQPCALATETELPYLNFNDGTIDVFSFLLKGGRQYRIAATVGPAGGLDPALAVFLAGATDAPLATNDDAQLGSASAALTLTVTADAWYLVQVTNQAPGSPLGKTYSLSARSVAAAGSSAPVPASDPDDLIGNAYDVAHAVRLAWNVPYDMSMRCPDPRPNACYAGRHTFLLVPLKAGVPFTALTYDLGAGVDTVLTLYTPDPTQIMSEPGLVPGWRTVVSNDDIAPGWTLRSQIGLTPAWTGLALLIVASSDREDLPAIPADGRPGRYRLLVGSATLPNVSAALAAQQDLPPTAVPPTPRPTSQAAPAAISTAAAPDAREVIKEACATGTALVGSTATDLYAAAPPGSDDRIASYPPGALVALLGQCYRGWVKVQPTDSVTPGWMWAATLRPEALHDGTPAAAGTPGSATTPTSATNTTSTSGTATPVPTSQPSSAALTLLAPAPLPTPVVIAPIARAVTVTVCRAAPSGDDCGTPLAGLRVALLLAATHQLRTSGVTDANGTVTLSVSVPAGSQLLLAIPALGLETPLAANATAVPVRVPQGDA